MNVFCSFIFLFLFFYFLFFSFFFFVSFFLSFFFYFFLFFLCFFVPFLLKARVLDIGENQQWKHARRIYPKSRGHSLPLLLGWPFLLLIGRSLPLRRLPSLVGWGVLLPLVGWGSPPSPPSWLGRLPSPFWLDGLPFLLGCPPPPLLVGGTPPLPLLVLWPFLVGVLPLGRLPSLVGWAVSFRLFGWMVSSPPLLGWLPFWVVGGLPFSLFVGKKRKKKRKTEKRRKTKEKKTEKNVENTEKQRKNKKNKQKKKTDSYYC